jgi:hypothetical protein
LEGKTEISRAEDVISEDSKIIPVTQRRKEESLYGYEMEKLLCGRINRSRLE